MAGKYAAPSFTQGHEMLVRNETSTLESASIFASGSMTELDTADLRIVGSATIEPQATIKGSGGLIITPGSTLSGNGTIGVKVINKGQVGPGGSAGEIRIEGDFFQQVSGTLLLEVGGLEPGLEYDVLTVTGHAELGGVLEMVLIDGFLPGDGDEFHFLEWGRRTGEFDTLTLPALPAGLVWDPSAQYETGGFSVEPEPATLALLGLGGLSVLLRRRLK
jgi:hypothetical protein